jgi:hypothetical protein
LWRAVSVTLEPGVESVHVRDGRSFFVADAKRCVMGCGEWLPLGPATDTAETAIEVRAWMLGTAEIIRACDMTEAEDAGWRAHQVGTEPNGPSEEVGWLAREIWLTAHHATEHGEG